MRDLYFWHLFLIVFLSFQNFIAQSKKDSVEFQHYFDKAYKLRSVNVDSAFYWIDNASEVAKKLGNKEWLAKAHNLKGILYYKKSQYFASITELDKALKLTNDQELKGKIYINLGNALSDLNYPYSAKRYYEDAIRMFNETQNYPFLVRALLNLATEEFNLKEQTAARVHLKLALYYAQQQDLVEETAICLNNLSAMFIKTGQIDSASRYIYQSFNNYEKTENYYGLADAYLTAISLHLAKKELSYAKALIDLADSIIDHLGYLEGKKNLTEHKVNYYLLSNDNELAKRYFNEYIQLEDSFYRQKKGNITLLSETNQTIPNKEITSFKNIKVSFLQLFITILIALACSIYLFKQYRYGEK